MAADVPVQIHGMDADPIFVGEGDIDAARMLVDSTDHAELFLYPGSYLNSLRAFEAAFVLDQNDGTQGIVGVAVRYHEWTKPETPKPGNLPRCHDVAERSGGFAPGALDSVKGRSELAVMWLEHVLLLSMRQHASGTWSRGRYVVVYPAGNTDFAAACARYRTLLVDQSTFSAIILEDVIDAGVLPASATLRERYTAWRTFIRAP